MRLLAFCFAVLAACSAHAQYPSKPIRFIVPFPAGGPLELVARVVGAEMAKTMGQPVVIDIRAGASGTIGAAEAARSIPDGHTIIIISSSHTITPAAIRLPYDPVKDFTFLSLLADAPFVLLAHSSVPASNLRELLALAKQKPKSLTYASFGSGTTAHLAGEVFSQAAGIELTHVPYKGSGPAVTDLVGGHVQLLFATTAVAAPHVKAGKIRMLAAAGARRFPAYPDMPTIAEQGFAGYESGVWFGIAAPANLTRDAASRLHADIVATLKAADVKARLDSLGAIAIGSSGDEFRSFVQVEMEKYARVVRAANIKVE
jgi:tripartite-type tricarboxylate transporter receptor subunit TctC